MDTIATITIHNVTLLPIFKCFDKKPPTVFYMLQEVPYVRNIAITVSRPTKPTSLRVEAKLFKTTRTSQQEWMFKVKNFKIFLVFV
jgi:hypothetical protein